MRRAHAMSMRFCWLWGMIGATSALGQAYPTPVRASWVEDPATTATITWDTPVPARGTVRYGLTTNYTQVIRDGGGIHRHVLALRNLQPGTRYFYEASATDGFLQPASFQTAALAGEPLHFAIHGDLNGGLNVSGAQEVSDQIVLEDPQWVVQLGDISDEAYSGAGIGTWAASLSVLSNELARTVFMPILGNHDDPGSGTEANPEQERGLYHRILSLPEPSLGNGFYAYTVGNIRFIGLNSEGDIPGQNDWLARELQAAANDTHIVWLMATCHRPPYCWGAKDPDLTVKENWSPLLTKYEADWLVSGHSHNYQRTVPIRGVNYLISGGAGGTLYDSAVGEPALLFATTCYHHVSCHITNDVMQLRAIRSDGKVFDTTAVTNRRQVRVAPAFPLRGENAKIIYRATEGPLAGANPVYIHLGVDAFTNAWVDAPMTWNPASQRWEFEFTVPAMATQRVAFVFHDPSGTNWHNNYSNDWQALLDRASVWPPPVAGAPATLRYEADMGPLAAISNIAAWVTFNNGQFTLPGPVALVRISGAHWEGNLLLPDYAENFTVHFTGGGLWDDNAKRRWMFTVAGATNRAWPPAPVAAWGSPVITDNPPGEFPDNIGDNFDLVQAGPPLPTLDAPRGFGDFGSIWVNVDATNLYLGGYGLDLGGSNNVIMLFLGLDTLADNAWNLWHKSGLPNALDYLHNVRFTEPMDIALLLGDAYGDGPSYTNFSIGGTGGYNFGQGVFYLSTNNADFVPMANARLSQFHGTGTVACATAGSSTNRRTTRWEVALPWSALNAAGPESVSSLLVGGVIGSSSVSGNDRYLSRACLGENAWGARDDYRQYAYYTLNLRPVRVNFRHGDLRGDGLSNGWRQDQFGTPDGPPADEDSDGDGQDNRAEEIAGTRPLDSSSYFAAQADPPAGETGFAVRWPFASGRAYDVFHTPDMMQPFQPLAVGLNTNRYEIQSNGFYRFRVRK
jgi:hypothetical protein